MMDRAELFRKYIDIVFPEILEKDGMGERFYILDGDLHVHHTLFDTSEVMFGDDSLQMIKEWYCDRKGVPHSNIKSVKRDTITDAQRAIIDHLVREMSEQIDAEIIHTLLQNQQRYMNDP